jgi:hypothetical protein
MIRSKDLIGDAFVGVSKPRIFRWLRESRKTSSRDIGERRNVNSFLFLLSFSLRSQSYCTQFPSLSPCQLHFYPVTSRHPDLNLAAQIVHVSLVSYFAIAGDRPFTRIR